MTTAGVGQVNWIDFLVHDRAPANTLCYNFAWTGATVTRSPGDPPVGQYYTFTDQIQEFQNIQSTAVGWNGNNTLAISWLGVNDVALNTVLGISFKNGANSQNGFDGIATPYFDQLDTLFQAGVRDFLILDVPPLDRAPTATDRGNATVYETYTNITAFNQVLRNQANAFLSAHQGSRISFLNTSVPFDSVISNPQQYGVSNASCWNSDGHTCLWANDAHPGVAIHQAVGEAAYDQLNGLGFWLGTYNTAPATTPIPMKSSAPGRMLSSTTLWLIVFAVGFASGRFTAHKKPWALKEKQYLG